MTTVVRPGTQDDLPLIAKHYGRGDTPWDPFGDVARLRKIPLGGFLVAEVDGEYAGFLYWFETERPWFDESVWQCAQIEELQSFPDTGGGKWGGGCSWLPWINWEACLWMLSMLRGPWRMIWPTIFTKPKAFSPSLGPSSIG